MQLKIRSYKQELLDSDDIPLPAIKKNLLELDVINTLLGGHNITLKGFKQLLGHSKQITVCEIGCGGGDNLAAIAKWCKRRNIKVQCIGIDIKGECITVARENKYMEGIAKWITSDYQAVVFEEKPDIIFSSLFCHHFTESQLVSQLQWMQANCGTGFFINDLHRHTLAYYSIKILTAAFSSSHLVKNDAPLSVAKGFVKAEWEGIFTKASILRYKIYWQWAFRHLITFKHGR